MAELGEQWGAEPGEDFIESWIQSFFAAPVTQQTQPEQQAQEPVRAANGQFAKRG
jgi:hypothetical protein